MQCTYILPNIWRSKDNQTKKFVQLIEYHMRNTFLEKSHRKCCESNQNWAYLWINSFKFYTVNGYLKILKLSCKPLPVTSYKTFLKNKKRSGTSLLASFSAWILNKSISLVIFYELTKFHCLVSFTSWDVGQCVYCKCLLFRLWRHKFWN